MIEVMLLNAHALPDELQTKLNISRLARPGNLGRGCLGYPGVRITEVWLVETIEELGTKLQLDTLCQRIVLDEAEVPVLKPRPIEDARA